MALTSAELLIAFGKIAATTQCNGCVVMKNNTTKLQYQHNAIV